MTRGIILAGITGAKAVERLRSLIGAPLPVPPGAPPDALPSLLRYNILPGHNGGTDPTAPHPGQPSYGRRVWTADCIGAVCWGFGTDRKQTARFGTYGGSMNTDSVIIDATGPQDLWVAVPWKDARVGDAVVYGGTIDPVTGKRHPGHIGLVSAVDATGPTKVIHCSDPPSHAKYTHPVSRATASWGS